MPSELWRFLEEASRVRPDDVAVVDPPRSWTWSQFHERCRRTFCRFGSLGLRAGDRWAVLDWNSHRYLEAYFAAAAGGWILCPLNTRLARKELLAVLTDGGVRCLWVHPAFRSLVEEGPPLPVPTCIWMEDEEAGQPGSSSPRVPVDVSPTDCAQIYYTSGTTGRPKGVMLTHGNVAAHAHAAVQELALGPGEIWGHVAPLFHLADAWAVFAITLALGRHVIVPRFDPELVVNAFESFGVTLTNLVPTMIPRLLDHPGLSRRDLGSLRRVLSGGAPIAKETVRRILLELGCDYTQTYGMTETSPFLTMSLLSPEQEALPFEERLALKAKTGRPFGPVELRVVREDGREVRPDTGEVGEIEVRGPTVTPGYWGRPEETALAFHEGWLRTGDLAVRDARGFVDIVDRKKDMMITGGENVYSTEVESALYAHPSVLEAAAFGIPDPTLGERIAAAVVLREGRTVSDEELRSFCREHLAGYKIPRSWVFLDELPKTGSGKISKRALRDLYGAAPTGG